MGTYTLFGDIRTKSHKSFYEPMSCSFWTNTMAINQAITQVYIRPVQGEGVAEM